MRGDDGDDDDGSGRLTCEKCENAGFTDMRRLRRLLPSWMHAVGNDRPAGCARTRVLLINSSSSSSSGGGGGGGRDLCQVTLQS